MQTKVDRFVNCCHLLCTITSLNALRLSNITLIPFHSIKKLISIICIGCVTTFGCIHTRDIFVLWGTFEWFLSLYC